MITQKTSYPYKGIYSIVYMIFAPQMLRTTTLNNVMSWKQRDYYMSQPTFNSILRSSVAIFLKLTCGFLLIHSAGLPSAEAQSWIHSCEDALIRYSFLNWSNKRRNCVYNIYLTRPNQPRKKYRGECSKVLPGKSWRWHHHLDLPTGFSIKVEVRNKRRELLKFPPFSKNLVCIQKLYIFLKKTKRE